MHVDKQLFGSGELNHDFKFKYVYICETSFALQPASGSWVGTSDKMLQP